MGDVDAKDADREVTGLALLLFEAGPQGDACPGLIGSAAPNLTVAGRGGDATVRDVCLEAAGYPPSVDRGSPTGGAHVRR
jgi:hypothetical protein